MSLDFTFNKYAEIIGAIASSDYEVITIENYILRKELPPKYIIIRHDVDLDPYYQLKFADLENTNNIFTSYYFRYIETIYKEDVITKIKNLGHEVGYHYEVFTKAKGNPEEAILIFREEQDEFAAHWKSKTVCPHGGSFVDNQNGYALKDIIKLLPKLLSGKTLFSKHVNFDMWDKHSFEDFNIIGDAYRSIDFSDILYLSDTGRSWDQRYKRLDRVDSNINPHYNVKSSDDIIQIIKTGKVNKIYLLIHFEQWKDNFKDWMGWYAAQVIRRTGKRLIFRNDWS